MSSAVGSPLNPYFFYLSILYFIIKLSIIWLYGKYSTVLKILLFYNLIFIFSCAALYYCSLSLLLLDWHFSTNNIFILNITVGVCCSEQWKCTWLTRIWMKRYLTLKLCSWMQNIHVLKNVSSLYAEKVKTDKTFWIKI